MPEIEWYLGEILKELKTLRAIEEQREQRTLELLKKREPMDDMANKLFGKIDPSIFDKFMGGVKNGD